MRVEDSIHRFSPLGCIVEMQANISFHPAMSQGSGIGFGFGVLSLRSGVWGLEFGVQGLEFGV